MPAAIPFIIQAVIGVVISVGLKLVASLLTPKPKKPELPNLDQRQAGTTVTARQPIGYWRVVYGEARVGGHPLYYGTSENNDKFHVVAACVAHEVDAYTDYVIGESWLHPDDLDASGNTLSGGPLYFSGKSDVRIQTKLGTANQDAFADLVAESAGEWSDAHRARGHALLYVRYTFQPTIFPGGLPNQSAVIRGKKVYDPRDNATRWTANAALCIRDFLLMPKALGGYGMASVDETAFAAAANVCDEFVASTGGGDSAQEVTSVSPGSDFLAVDDEYLKFQAGDRVELTTTGTLPGGLSPATSYYVIPHRRRASKVTTTGSIVSRPSLKLAASYADALARSAIDITDAGSGTHTVTKTGEPRYTLNGTYTLDQSPRKVLEELLTCCAGRVPEGAGLMRLMGLAWEAPTLTLDEDLLRGPLVVQTRRSRRDRFNAIRGTYVSPLNDYQPSDYPAVTSAIYQAQDGERAYGDYDQPYTSRAGQAQRVAKVELARNRFERTVQYPALLGGYDCKAGEVVAVTNARWAWSSKTFEVLEWRPEMISGGEGEAPYLGLVLSLNETDSSIFDWASAEEGAPTPVIQPTLPNWRFVPAPTSLYARTLTIETDQADIVFTALLSWAMASGIIVDRGGRFEIQTRRTVGGALLFDGVDDFVQFASTIDLTSDAVFTVEVFAAQDGGHAGNDQGIFTNGQVSIWWRASDGKVVVDVSIGGTSATLVSDAALVTDDFTHVAVTWDGSTANLFIDAVLNDSITFGSEEERVTEAGETRLTEAGEIRITETFAGTLGAPITAQLGRGKDGTADTAYWSGLLDELRVWRGVVRTAAELDAYMDASLNGREDGLLGYWPMDVPIAGELVDATVGGNSGTITGALYDSGALAASWEPSWFVDGAERQATVPPLKAANTYDIRMRAINPLGVASEWTMLEGFTVGSSGGAVTVEDWGLITDAPDSPGIDWGSVADAAGETEDYGAIT